MAATSGATARYDAIVIGGGHNGLVAAAYLGKAGLRTRRPRATATRWAARPATSELAPGARVPTLAHTVGRLRPSVVRDLELKRHGLSLVGAGRPRLRAGPGRRRGRAVGRRRRGRPRDSGPGPRPTPIATRRSTGWSARCRRFLGELAGADAARHRRRRVSATRWPGSGSGGRSAASGATTAGRSPASCRWPIADFVAESFESDAVQAAIAWRGVQYTAMGPWSAGTTAVLLADSAGNDGGAAGQTVFARGGPGALVDRARGGRARGRRRDPDAVPRSSRSPRADGRATGVALASGEELAARAVVAGIDPKRALTQLVDPVAIGPSLLWRAGNIRTPGTVAKVNLVLARPAAVHRRPATTTAAAPRPDPASRPGIDAMERAHDAAKYGRPSEHADDGGDDPVARRPVARRWARAAGHRTS